MSNRSAAPTHRRASARLSAAGVIGSELTKLASVPAMRWLAVAVVGAGALGGVLFGSGAPGAPASAAIGATGAASLAGSVFALMAGLSFAGEYATGSIRTSATVVPRRGLLFGAKAVAVAVVGVVLGALAAVLGVQTSGAGIAADAVLPVLGAALYVATAGLFGLFLGGVVRRVAATAVTVLVAVFLLPAAGGSVRVGDAFLSDYLLGESGPTLVAGTGSWAMPLAAVTAWLLLAAVVAAVRFRATDA